MNWKKLFAIHILERGHDYYCDDAVENMEISDDIISYKKKLTAVEELVRGANEEDVRSFLAAVLAEDEKLLLRFHNTINKQVTREDINNYIRQVDIISDRYLGRNHFISYYEADGFISELEEIIDEDVRRMIDNGNYLSAFEVMNYIFVLIGDVDMDDSDGGTGLPLIWMALL